jgi:hypothetical protein
MFYDKVEDFLMHKILSATLLLFTMSCVMPGMLTIPDQHVARLMPSTVNIYFEITGKIQDKANKEVSAVYAGSGVVVSVSHGKSLVVTAAHVLPPNVGSLVVEDDEPAIKITRVEGTVVNINKQMCQVESFYKYPDEKEDLAALVINCANLGPAVKVAKKLPPVGDFIVTVSQPRGARWAGFSVVQDGRYLGLDTTFIRDPKEKRQPRPAFNLPSVGGMSGGPIYYKGELISILQSGIRGYEHITFGASLDVLSQMISKIKSVDTWWKS